MNLESSNGNSYNNADSFAMAFDAAWKNCDLENDKDIEIEEKIERTWKEIKENERKCNEMKGKWKENERTWKENERKMKIYKIKKKNNKPD